MGHIQSEPDGDDVAGQNAGKARGHPHRLRPAITFVILEQASKNSRANRTDLIRRRLRTAAFVACATAVVFAVAGLLRWAITIFIHRNQGLDPSDEASYLISSTTPGSAVAIATNYGHYTHLLLQISGGSLGSFRLSGLALMLVSTFAAAWGVSRWFHESISDRWRRVGLVSLWCCLSATAATHYAAWIVTPGYNLLTFSLGMVVFSGLLSAFAAATGELVAQWWRPISGYVIVGVSGAFLADIKITAAFATGLLCLIGIALVRGLREPVRTAWSLGVGIVVGVGCTIVLDGSPITTLKKYSRGSQAITLAHTHIAKAVLETDFVHHAVLPWLGWFVVAAAVIAVGWHWIRRAHVRVALMTVGACMVGAQMWSQRPTGGVQVLASTGGWWWFRATAWALLLVTALASTRSRSLAIGPIIALGAWGLTIGSNTGFIREGVLTTGLFSLAIVTQAVIVAFRLAVEPARALPAAIMSVVLAATSFALVPEALASPYRLDGPMGTNTSLVHLASFGDIDVTPFLAQYITDLQAIAPFIPVDARDCLVDLAGGTPLSALALGVQSATLPWEPGGYPGSAKSLAYLLEFAPCIDGPVLLIDAPLGTRRIALPDVLAGRTSHLIGTVNYNGYLNEDQTVSVLDPPTVGS